MYYFTKGGYEKGTWKKQIRRIRTAVPFITMPTEMRSL